jgi:spore coat protein U-like protein
MVSVTVAATCTVSSNPLTFGTYTPGSGSLNADTTLSVRCSHGAPFTVAMDAGTGGGNLLQRFMTSGAARLQYNLYTSAARTSVWGDGSISSAIVTGTGKGLASNGTIIETVYGQLPDTIANQQLAPGIYTDTIRITVSY